MCGRVRTPEDFSEVTNGWQRFVNIFGDYKPRYNAPPTARLPIITLRDGTRTIEPGHWWFVPPWSKEIKTPFASFNAKCETFKESKLFAPAWKSGRTCVMITSGFYEWRKADKQPFAVALGNRQPMLMAGLYSDWTNRADGTTTRTFTILTTAASPGFLPVHDRQPVVLDDADVGRWIGEEEGDRESLIRALPIERLSLWPVGKAVGSVKNEGPELAEPITL